MVWVENLIYSEKSVDLFFKRR